MTPRRVPCFSFVTFMDAVRKHLPSTMVLGLCRRMNNICVSWLLYLAVTACIGFLTQMQLKFAMKLMTDGNKHVFQFGQTLDNSTQNVIISGYANGGCNVVGEVLGTRPETFYVYEPLASIAESYYFKNSSTTCPTLFDKCFRSTLPNMALDTVRNVLSCGKINVGEEYNQKWDKGGEVWLKYQECLLDKEYNKEFCDEYLSYKCNSAKVNVIKTERLSTELLGKIMGENSNVSVVHIFRDPRGILYLSMKSSAFPGLKKASGIKEYAKSLCSRMREDLKTGLELSSLYPKRFKLMLYEDFALDMVTVVKPLFRFLRIPMFKNDRDIVEVVGLKEGLVQNNDAIDSEDSSDTKSTKVHPFNWRENIDMKTLQVIDEFCGDLYVKLGYNSYRNEQELRNLTGWSSYGGGGVYPL